MLANKIIIADDEAHVTYILAAKIRAAGFEAITASDGAQALELIKEHNPILVLTDYQMPVLSGFEMCVKLKEDPATANIPVIMLTARGHHLSSTELARTNIRFLFPKPFSAKELLAKITEVLATTPQPVYT